MKTTSSRPLFISHRGESSKAPENTLAAFRYAMDGGADGMETDIHFTKDGIVVCSHDCSTKRVFGTEMLVEEHTLAELRQLKAVLHADKYPDETVPTLAEALKVLKPGKLFYIEVKHDDPRLVDAMVKEIRAAGVPASQIVVISFRNEAIKYCKATYPEYKALWLTCFEKDAATGKYLYDAEHYVRIMKELGVDGVDCIRDLGFMDEKFYRAMREANLEISVWTVDDMEAARRLVQDGVEGITSNRALELMAELC